MRLDGYRICTGWGGICFNRLVVGGFCVGNSDFKKAFYRRREFERGPVARLKARVRWAISDDVLVLARTGEMGLERWVRFRLA